MKELICVICKLRVSEWMMSNHKCEFVDGKLVHKACAMDYKLRTGRIFVPSRDE